MQLKVRFPKGNRKTAPGSRTTAVLEVDQEALNTIYYALGEYKRNLLKTAGAHEDNLISVHRRDIEDESFCYTAAGACANLEYLIRWDQREEAEEFMDVINLW